MIDIRKISIGQDYKNDAMHYIVGQPVLDKTYIIHLIQFDGQQQSLKIWIKKTTRSYYGKSLILTCQQLLNTI